MAQETKQFDGSELFAALPENLRPAEKTASAQVKGYLRVDLPEGLARQIAQAASAAMKAAGQTPGIHQRRGKDGSVIRTTAGLDLRCPVRLAGGVEVSATVKWPVNAEAS